MCVFIYIRGLPEIRLVICERIPRISSATLLSHTHGMLSFSLIAFPIYGVCVCKKAEKKKEIE